MEDNLPDEIYLSVIGETTFLCIRDAHMWPVNSIQYINMTLGKRHIHITFAGNQTWTFKDQDADMFKAIVNKNKNEADSITKRMAGK
jgi:hypothetical protein